MHIFLKCILGRYICVAENTVGITEAVADIKVEITSAPPKLIFEPYDIDALPGTTIELPCQGEGTPPPEVCTMYDASTFYKLLLFTASI